jgi:recombination protein RecA
MRLDIRRIQSIKSDGEVVGNRTKVTVKKNKVAPPFKIAEFDIMYNQGVSKVGDVIDIAVTENIIEKRGSFYAYGETRLAQGREKAKDFLLQEPELLFEIENKVRSRFNLPTLDYYSASNKQPDEASTMSEK